LWDESELTQQEISVHWVDRGGDVTYHGPGQLVGYPLIPLGVLKKGKEDHIPKVDYVGYIRKLEQVLVLTLATLGVDAKPVEGLTGVWIDRDQFSVISELSEDTGRQPIAKLAAIGVKIDARGVTRHGFALNVNPNMAYWEGIIGCGLEYPEIDLSQLLDPTPSMQTVIEAIIHAFGHIFNYDLRFEAQEGGDPEK
jgi:lipoate-protein ligase B